MRIAYVLTGLYIGGAERQVAALANEMSKRGHDIHVISLLPIPESKGIILPPSAKCHSLGMHKGIPGIGGLLALKRILTAIDPDIVHAHMIHANLLSRMTRILCPMHRLICTAHSDVETKKPYLKFLYRVTDPLCDAMTNVSQSAVDRFINDKISPDRKIRCVYDGLDFGLFSSASMPQALPLRAELGLPAGGKVVVFAGRLEPVKGCDLFVEAARIIIEAGNNDIGFAVLGDGSLRSDLEKSVKHLPRIRFYGMVNDVRPFYASADVFAMPSRNEGFGLALVEAIAAGLEPVVSDCAGPREIMGLAGFDNIVERGNPAALASGILAAAGEGRSGEEKAERGKRLSGIFDIRLVCDEWERLYRG